MRIVVFVGRFYVESVRTVVLEEGSYVGRRREVFLRMVFGEVD